MSDKKIKELNKSIEQLALKIKYTDIPRDKIQIKFMIKTFERMILTVNQIINNLKFQKLVYADEKAINK